MLPVQRLMFAAQLRNALAATTDLEARGPLDAQDRLSLQTTVAALTESGPPSREMADIQLNILTQLPGWPMGLSIIRLMAPDSGGPPDPTRVSDRRQFGAQTSQLAEGDPLLIYGQTDGSWFFARNAKPPHDWRPAPDRTRPLLSACVSALVDRFKDDGWRIVARIAKDSRHGPGNANESLLLARLGMRMADWLDHVSEYDRQKPLLLAVVPATQPCTPPAARPVPAASTPTVHPITGARSASPPSPLADTWAEIETFLSGKPTHTPSEKEDSRTQRVDHCQTETAQIIRSEAWPPSPAFKKRRLDDTSTRSPDSTAPASHGTAQGPEAHMSDGYILRLLKTPGTPSPRITPSITPSIRPRLPEPLNHFIDLTARSSRDPN